MLSDGVDDSSDLEEVDIGGATAAGDGDVSVEVVVVAAGHVLAALGFAFGAVLDRSVLVGVGAAGHEGVAHARLVGDLVQGQGEGVAGAAEADPGGVEVLWSLGLWHGFSWPR